MTFSEMRVDMSIRNRQTGLKATIAEIRSGKFKIVDEHGDVDSLDRYEAGNWEKIK